MLRVYCALLLAAVLAAMSQEEQNALWKKAMEESAAATHRSPSDSTLAHPSQNTDAEGNEISRAYPHVKISELDKGAMPEPADVRAERDRERAEKARSDRIAYYGIDWKIKISELGEVSPSVIPDSLRGMYFTLTADKSDQVEYDKIITPHDAIITAETISVRPMSYLNKTVRTMPEPTPVQVFAVNGGYILRLDKHQSYALLATKQAGVYLLNRYSGNDPIISRFCLLKQ